MDTYYWPFPLPPATYPVHVQVQAGGSEFLSNDNSVYGYIEHLKPRWEIIHSVYQDAGALDRFGYDPTHPPGPGVTLQSDGYGYPEDGWTTGYTTKLPPPADFAVAQQTPASFNTMQIVSAGNGQMSTEDIPGDNPVDFINYFYKNLTHPTHMQNVRRRKERAPAYEPEVPT